MLLDLSSWVAGEGGSSYLVTNVDKPSSDLRGRPRADRI